MLFAVCLALGKKAVVTHNAIHDVSRPERRARGGHGVSLVDAVLEGGVGGMW